jgi:hypothetical protein
MKPGFRVAAVMIALGVLWLWTSPAQAYIVPPYDYFFRWDADGLEVIKDTYGYGDPVWEDGRNLWIPNLFTEQWSKTVWLEVNWTDLPSEPPPMEIETQEGTQIVDFSPAQGPNDWTYRWGLFWQPAWERITFPTSDYHNLTGGVTMVEVATWCFVPEPGTIWLLAAAGLGLAAVGLARRRWKA